MGTGGGHDLSLHAAGTLSQGDRLRRAAEDLDAVGKTLGQGVSSPLDVIASWLPFGEETFGEYGADAAFPPFARAWNQEIAALAGALREIRDKIGDGVATTTASDHATEREMDSLRRSGGGPR